MSALGRVDIGIVMLEEKGRRVCWDFRINLRWVMVAAGLLRRYAQVYITCAYATCVEGGLVRRWDE